jgi:hypothetical protein
MPRTLPSAEQASEMGPAQPVTLDWKARSLVETPDSVLTRHLAARPLTPRLHDCSISELFL